MYTEFFGLREAPFNSTPDPKFFFSSPQHEEALASLVYAVQERKGLVVLTGEVGAGKTFVSHMLVQRLGAVADTAVLSPTSLNGMDLLEGIAREFQTAMEASYNTMELLASLEDHLLALYSKGRLAVLLIDEAHTLSEKDLEHLRLISNLEVADGKLLQIVLLGQHDLTARLQKAACKQLRQRVFRSFHIERLSRDLAERYIHSRLRAAGRDEPDFFEESAIDLIHQYANGIPRLINNLCDNLLLSAYSDGVGTIDRQRVCDVIEEMMADPSTDQPEGAGDGVDSALSEITSQYVQSLESQLSQLESTSAETDQRIHELYRLSTKLQAQELKFGEHQSAIDAKVRELHRLTVTLEEQEHSLGQREKVLEERVQELRSLLERLGSQEKALAEREARLAQQMQEMQRVGTQLADQDHRLTERAGFIEQKLANRQASIDRELAECKRALNRKWQDMKKLIAEFEDREAARAEQVERNLNQRRYDCERAIQEVWQECEQNTNEKRKQYEQALERKWQHYEQAIDHRRQHCERFTIRKTQDIKQLIGQFEARESARTKQMAAVDQRLTRFEALTQQYDEQESGLRELVTAVGQDLERLTTTHEQLLTGMRAAERQVADSTTRMVANAEDVTHHLQQLVDQASVLLQQPNEIMDKAARQTAQVERMTKIVQKATVSLQKTIDDSIERCKVSTREGKELCTRLVEIEEEVQESMRALEQRGAKTHQLREVLRKIYEQSAGQVMALKSVVREAEMLVSKLPKQLEELREHAVHPARLMKELRTIGSVAERNVQDGQLRLAELRTMVDKAERARQSIEAIIHATRRVAENRRHVPAGRGEPSLGERSGGLPQPLTSKIDSLTEAVRKVRDASDLTVPAPSGSDADEPVIGLGEQG